MQSDPDQRSWLAAQKWRILLSLLVLGALFFFLKRHADFDSHAFFVTLGGFEHRWIAISLAIALVQVLAQATRLWRLFPRPVPLDEPPPPSWLAITYPFIIGQCVNMFAPARAGDFLKLGLITRNENQRTVTVTAALVLDKLIDAISFMLVVIILCSSKMGVYAAEHLSPTKIELALGAIAVVIAALWFGLIRKHLRDNKLPKLAHPRLMAWAMLISAAAWIAESTALNAVARGLHLHLSLSDSTWVLFLLNLGTAVPISIGNVGIFEAAIAFGLRTIGIPFEIGIVIGTVHHAIQVGTVYIWAAVLWPFRRKAAVEVAAPAPAVNPPVGEPAPSANPHPPKSPPSAS